MAIKFKKTQLNYLYYFHYDAKYKKQLPVWDKRPLVIALHAGKKSFLGLNVHHLPMAFKGEGLLQVLTLLNYKSSQRDKKGFLKKLSKIFSKQQRNRKTRVTYGQVKSQHMKGNDLLYNIIRRYLYNRVTNMKKVPYVKWENYILTNYKKLYKDYRSKMVFNYDAT